MDTAQGAAREKSIAGSELAFLPPWLVSGPKLSILKKFQPEFAKPTAYRKVAIGKKVSYTLVKIKIPFCSVSTFLYGMVIYIPDRAPAMFTVRCGWHLEVGRSHASFGKHSKYLKTAFEVLK